MNARQLKFRVWSQLIGRFCLDTENSHFGQSEDFANGKFVIGSWGDDVVQEYTGLKDINDVEIYEGDIIKKTYKDGQVSCNMQVMWSNIDALWWTADLPNYNDKGQELYMYPDCEVIGNIFENPELLQLVETRKNQEKYII